MNNQIERFNNRIILSGVGIIPTNTALYNKKYGVTMKQSCSCGTYDSDTTNLCHDMSQAAEYNFTIYKGSTLDFDVVYKDASKTPVNLTGYKARCVAQYNDKTFTLSSVICDVSGGKIHIGMSAYETSRIFTLDYKYSNATEYTYQLELISPSKIVYRIMEGVITVKPSAGC